jgi:hypothetical protein
VVVVYLDLASYQRQGLDPLKPWPRGLHAQLLHRLTAERARAVIFDIVFSGAGPVAADDEAFARAIRENARVVLAAECNYGSSHVTGDNQVRGARAHLVRGLCFTAPGYPTAPRVEQGQRLLAALLWAAVVNTSRQL